MSKDTSGFDNMCGACDHKANPDGGHCYMFRNEPTTPCGQHTAVSIRAMHTRSLGVIATMKRMHADAMLAEGNKQ